MRRVNVLSAVGVAAMFATLLVMPQHTAAQPKKGTPTIIGLTSHTQGQNTSRGVVYRLWSDGLVEWNENISWSCGGQGQWCGWRTVPES